MLTGRIAIYELAPFAIEKTKSNQIDDLWLMEGFANG
jgi:hypothetical protein